MRGRRLHRLMIPFAKSVILEVVHVAVCALTGWFVALRICVIDVSL